MSDKLGSYQLNSIVTGDCLEVMPLLPDKSVDMLLSDWPYGTTACEWDSIIPLEPLWEQCKRVIKPDGAIVLTASQPFTSVLIMSNLNWFKYCWMWDKVSTSNHLNCTKQPLRAYEDVCVFYSQQCTYNPILRTKNKENIRANNIPTRKEHQTYGAIKPIQNRHEFRQIPVDMSYPTNVIRIPGLNGQEKSEALHPTQKPVALFSYLVRTYSNPGDLILDNAAGSCTAAIAAIDTGRNWLCIERDSGYAEIGRNRVAERLSQPFLPGMVEAAKPESIQLEFGG